MWGVLILAAVVIAPFLADTSPPPPPPVEPPWAPSGPGASEVVTERTDADGSVLRTYGPAPIVPPRYRVLLGHRLGRFAIEGGIKALRAAGVRVLSVRFGPKGAPPPAGTSWPAGETWAVLEVSGEGEVGQRPPFTAVGRASLPLGTDLRVRDTMTRRGWNQTAGRWVQVEGSGIA